MKPTIRQIWFSFLLAVSFVKAAHSMGAFLPAQAAGPIADIDATLTQVGPVSDRYLKQVIALSQVLRDSLRQGKDTHAQVVSLLLVDLIAQAKLHKTDGLLIHKYSFPALVAQGYNREILTKCVIMATMVYPRVTDYLAHLYQTVPGHKGHLYAMHTLSRIASLLQNHSHLRTPLQRNTFYQQARLDLHHGAAYQQFTLHHPQTAEAYFDALMTYQNSDYQKWFLDVWYDLAALRDPTILNLPNPSQPSESYLQYTPLYNNLYYEGNIAQALMLANVQAGRTVHFTQTFQKAAEALYAPLGGGNNLNDDSHDSDSWDDSSDDDPNLQGGNVNNPIPSQNAQVKTFFQRLFSSFYHASINANLGNQPLTSIRTNIADPNENRSKEAFVIYAPYLNRMLIKKEEDRNNRTIRLDIDPTYADLLPSYRIGQERYMVPLDQIRNAREAQGNLQRQQQEAQQRLLLAQQEDHQATQLLNAYEATRDILQQNFTASANSVSSYRLLDQNNLNDQQFLNTHAVVGVSKVKILHNHFMPNNSHAENEGVVSLCLDFTNGRPTQDAQHGLLVAQPANMQQAYTHFIHPTQEYVVEFNGQRVRRRLEDFVRPLLIHYYIPQHQGQPERNLYLLIELYKDPRGNNNQSYQPDQWVCLYRSDLQVPFFTADIITNRILQKVRTTQETQHIFN